MTIPELMGAGSASSNRYGACAIARGQFVLEAGVSYSYPEHDLVFD